MKHLNRFKDINNKIERVYEQYTEKDFVAFKMRAETPDDVIAFLDKAKYLISEYHVVTNLSNGGLVVDFKSRETIENLLDIIEDITDGHIMHRTLDYKSSFDGSSKRN